MKLFQTSGVISLFGGLVGLNEHQATLRKLALEKVEGDVYRVVSEVQFKAGEVIGLESVPKVFKNILSDLSEPEDEKKETPFNMDVLIKAMFDLDPENPAHWTRSGNVKVGVIEELTGMQVTSKQCNEAWAEFQKG